MSKFIWKSAIQCNSHRGRPYEIKVPARKGARAISVALQGEDVCVWFEVDPTEDLADLVLYCVGTGWGTVPVRGRFLGTVVQGEFVWHLYAEN